MVKVWYMDDDFTKDPRLEHHQNPKKYVPENKVFWLTKVQIHKINIDKYDSDPTFLRLKKENGYSYQDYVTIAKSTLPDYEKKIKMFYTEHLHDDDEVRFFLDGSGYFDVRNMYDKWIRIHAEKGDLLILPAGIYHRFSPDMLNYARVMRLFAGDPVWTPINRSTVEETRVVPKSRVAHLNSLGKNTLKDMRAQMRRLHDHHKFSNIWHECSVYGECECAVKEERECAVIEERKFPVMEERKFPVKGDSECAVQGYSECAVKGDSEYAVKEEGKCAVKEEREYAGKEEPDELPE